MKKSPIQSFLIIKGSRY